jgi:hypothetical protein
MSKFAAYRKYGREKEDLAMVGQKHPDVWIGGGQLDRNVKIQYKWNEDEVFIGTVTYQAGKKNQVSETYNVELHFNQPLNL